VPAKIARKLDPDQDFANGVLGALNLSHATVTLQFVASARAAEVEKRLRDVPPQEGEFGQYW